MREIKFRAWDKNGKVMNYSGMWLDNTDGFLKSVNEVIVMQFTGLKDREGIEIYEGDIFEALHDFGPGGLHEKIGTVEFDNEKGYQWNYWSLSGLKVIGNIMENPELIKN